MNVHQKEVGGSGGSSSGARAYTAKWAAIQSNKKGTFSWVTKHSLQVDDAYQRDQSQEKIKRILATGWSWAGCGVLLVTRRTDGQLFVLDGGHRLTAAMRLPEIESLPCMIFALVDTQEEASAFLVSNILRKPLTSIDTYKARLVAGDPLAMQLERIVTSTGHHVEENTGRYAVRCVTALSRCLSLNVESLVKVWPLVVEAHGENHITEKLATALWYLHHTTDGQIMSRLHSQKIAEAGMTTLNVAMNNQQAAFSRGGTKIWARGLALWLNRGLRTNKIKVPDIEESR